MCSSVISQEIGREEHLRNNIFSVKSDVKIILRLIAVVYLGVSKLVSPLKHIRIPLKIAYNNLCSYARLFVL